MRLQLAVLFLLAIGTQALAPDVFAAGPDDARRHMFRGKAAMKDAKDATGFLDAAKEFDSAAAADPKLAEAAYNAGVAFEKAGDAASAMARFRVYLDRAPKAKDAQAVKDRIFELEYRAEKASDASGCWRRPDFKPSDLVPEDWCTFVVTRVEDKSYRVAPKIDVRNIGHGVISDLHSSVEGVRTEGRRLRFTMRYFIRSPGYADLPSYEEYDLTLAPDGKRFVGTRHHVDPFFKTDKTFNEEYVRYKKGE